MSALLGLVSRDVKLTKDWISISIVLRLGAESSWETEQAATLHRFFLFIVFMSEFEWSFVRLEKEREREREE